MRKDVRRMKEKREKGNHGKRWVRIGRAVSAKQGNLEGSETQLSFAAVAILTAITLSLRSKLWFWRIDRMALFNVN